MKRRFAVWLYRNATWPYLVWAPGWAPLVTWPYRVTVGPIHVDPPSSHFRATIPNPPPPSGKRVYKPNHCVLAHELIRL